MKQELHDKLFEILDEFGEKLTADLVFSLRGKGFKGSGGTESAIAGSIRFQFIDKPGSQGISISMADYWQALETGRRPGKMPPIDKLIAWLKWKGIVPKLSERAKAHAKIIHDKQHRKDFKQASIDKQLKSLAFAIAKIIEKKGTIKRFGYGGSHFASEVLNDGRIQELEKRVADEIGIMMVADITDSLKQKT